MLLVPWQIKRLEKGEGRLFAMLFSIGNRISVVLAYLPPSLGAVGLAFPLLLGFYVWEFFMLVAAAQFMRTLWGDNWGYAPAMFLTLLLFCLPILRGEWKLAPEPPEHAAIAERRSLPVIDPEKVQSTDLQLETSSNPSLGGQPVTSSTRVSVPHGPVPSGTISITEGRTILYQMHTEGDATSFSTNTLSIGEHWIHATFTPDINGLYLSSGESLHQFVNNSKDRKTRTVLRLKEQHLGRAGTIGFTLGAKMSTDISCRRSTWGEKGFQASCSRLILE